MPPTRAWMSWSSGKDSIFALHTARRDETVEVVGLLTTMNRDADRVAMHAVRRELVEAQADRLGLPLHVVEIPSPCPNEVYEERMAAALAAAVADGVDCVMFGDLHLADESTAVLEPMVRHYREIAPAAEELAVHHLARQPRVVGRLVRRRGALMAVRRLSRFEPVVPRGEVDVAAVRRDAEAVQRVKLDVGNFLSGTLGKAEEFQGVSDCSYPHASADFNEVNAFCRNRELTDRTKHPCLFPTA